MEFENIKTKWDLTKFYSGLDDVNLQNDIELIMKLIDEFVIKYKGKIKTFNENNFLEFFSDEDEIELIINKIGMYLFLLSTLDTQDQKVIKKMGEFENTMTEIANKMLFVSQEYKDIGYEKLIEFSKSETLKDYSNLFYQKAISVKYLLDEKTEFALNLKDNSGSNAFKNLYEELTNSFMFKVNLDGEEKILTDSEVRALRSNPDEKVRIEAYRSLREVYNDKKVQIALGNTYSSIIKDWTSEVKIRGYNNVMSQRNLREELDDEVVNILLSQVQNSYPIFQKYLRIKAKLLGKKKLMNWDMFAPISSEKKEYPFEENLKLFLDVIKEFDEEFYNYSLDMFKSSRVDVYPNKGKRGGAFACYQPKFESYVLLNYTNEIRDVATLAHELGHATHGYLSQVQKSSVYNSPLSLAETASIFNEMILGEALMQKFTDKEKLIYLEKRLDDTFSTIFRQVQYVLFEKRCHETILSGKELTYEDFNKIWREEQIKMSGDCIEYDVSENEESGWSTIPHIFVSPFYCYSYVFGNLLTFALYEKYKKEGKSFVEKYKNILRAGGSKIPYDLLIENGIDIKSEEHYKSGLKVVSDMVDEFERLAENGI